MRETDKIRPIFARSATKRAEMARRRTSVCTVGGPPVFVKKERFPG